jgi:hypothetical protein
MDISRYVASFVANFLSRQEGNEWPLHTRHNTQGGWEQV